MPSEQQSVAPIEPGQPADILSGAMTGPAELAEAICLPRPSTLPVRVVCRIVGHMTSEMVALVGIRVQLRGDRRRTLCHVRQIAMYVCHVALQIPQYEIGLAFGRDRTTVGHACNVIEDRRDDPAFDDFVSAVERMVTSVFSPSGSVGHE